MKAKAGPDPTVASTSSGAADADSSNTHANATANPPPASKPGRGPGSRARWTPAEDRKLIQFVHYADPPLTWDEIGAKMGRAATGCSMRWYKFLRDKSSGPNRERVSPFSFAFSFPRGGQDSLALFLELKLIPPRIGLSQAQSETRRQLLVEGETEVKMRSRRWPKLRPRLQRLRQSTLMATTRTRGKRAAP